MFITGENILEEDREHSQLSLLASIGADSIRPRPATYGVELNFNW